MQSNKRILAVVALIVILVAVVIGVTFFQRQMVTLGSQPSSGSPTPLPAGAIPIYWNGELVGGFSPDGLDQLQKAQFTDTAENKLQDGWLLKDILLTVIPAEKLSAQTQVIFSSSSRDKSASLSWAEIQAPENFVMFDLSNRGTLKLVSVLPQLDGRNEWVQDVDRIEIKTP